MIAAVDCTAPDFWEQRYRANRTPWDLHDSPAALRRFLDDPNSPRGRALIPGCGSGYEIALFAEAGFTPTAIDFSPAAVERARALPGLDPASVRQADFFADDFGRDFDLVYERTFLCSMPPERWPDYARRMAGLLRPGGVLLGVFAYGDEPEPPPFPIASAAAANALFTPLGFTLEIDVAIPPAESLPIFAGKERWQVWRLDRPSVS